MQGNSFLKDFCTHSQQPIEGAIKLSFLAADCLSEMKSAECVTYWPTSISPEPVSSQYSSSCHACLKKAFVLWGLPKILTVLGRESTLILGTFSFFPSHGDSFPDSMKASISAVRVII